MCSDNLEGLCLEKIRVENKTSDDIFNYHMHLSEQERICKIGCNGYDKPCSFYRPATKEELQKLMPVNLELKYNS